ncbi:NADPH:quinone reductase [Spongiactinospora sp. TRM90649]|uniref:NADPH:quinone reductase n=1 Tax=Spongiactinospora sp. TRM90649 TaxID=3031114 RepID=UPI0023F9C00D|nr:NADPH:quinone reductase [Spongiactinospora sp. TRM90649]MDF5752896.1 NADPH:quinone reductase [Spongiactinospora sp. TRM90649]
MRAAYVERLGPASEIRYGELPDPRCGPGEVAVRVAAAAVDGVDTFVRSGAYATPVPLPLVLGRDLVGKTVESDTWVWTNSLGHDGRQGASAELACVPADRLYPLPEGVDPLEAVAVLHPAATAYTGLVHHARLRPGETLFVEGGNGAVGRCLIRLAAGLGARVIASARGAAKAETCRAFGAHTVIDSTSADPRAALAALAELAPDGVDVYCDTTGRTPPGQAVPTLAVRGRVLVMAGLGGDPAPLDAGPLYVHDRSIIGFVISLATTEELAEAAEWINAELTAGLRLGTRVMNLERAREAHEAVESGTRDGRRLILRVSRAVR